MNSQGKPVTCTALKVTQGGECPGKAVLCYPRSPGILGLDCLLVSIGLESGLPMSECLYSILCGSQDSWALNKYSGRGCCACANRPNGPQTSSGPLQHFGTIWKTHPFHFRTRDVFIAVHGRMALVGENMKYAASHSSKRHLAVTPCNPCSVGLAGSCHREAESLERLPDVFILLFINQHRNQIKVNPGQIMFLNHINTLFVNKEVLPVPN